MAHTGTPMLYFPPHTPQFTIKSGGATLCPIWEGGLPSTVILSTPLPKPPGPLEVQQVLRKGGVGSEVGGVHVGPALFFFCGAAPGEHWKGTGAGEGGGACKNMGSPTLEPNK